MPHAALFRSHDFQPVTRKPARRSDGRELLVFESIVALLALLLIISGFSLYVSQAFSAPDETLPSGATRINTATIQVDRPLSLVEA